MKSREQKDEEQRKMRERNAAIDAASQLPADKDAPLHIKEAAPLWGFSTTATRRHFVKLEGVQVHVSPARRVNGRHKRKYVTVLIPPSILHREVEKRTNKPQSR
jgi:hypothetical protein